MLDDNTTDKIFDDLVLEKTTLLNELKTVYKSSLDSEGVKKERIINGKLSAVESMIRNVLKYKNIIAKEKFKNDL